MSEAEKLKTQKPEETVSRAEFEKLKIALEFAKDENKSSLQTIKQLEAMRAKEREEMHSLKISSEFVKNGGNDLYFDDFKKLTRDEEKVDYDALKMKYKAMFNQTTQSVGSPVNEQPGLNEQGAGRINTNQNRTVGMSGGLKGSQE